MDWGDGSCGVMKVYYDVRTLNGILYAELGETLQQEVHTDTPYTLECLKSRRQLSYPGPGTF